MHEPTPTPDTEIFAAPSEVAPEYETHTDFDWDELSRLLGEIEQRGERDYADLSEILCRVLGEVVRIEPRTISAHRGSAVATRVIALAYVVRPALLGDGMSSLRAVADRFALNRGTLEHAVEKLRKAYGLRAHHQPVSR